MLVTRALDTLSTRLRCVALLRSLLTSLLRSAWRYSVHHPESAAAAIAALGAIQVDSYVFTVVSLLRSLLDLFL